MLMLCRVNAMVPLSWNTINSNTKQGGGKIGWPYADFSGSEAHALSMKTKLSLILLVAFIISLLLLQRFSKRSLGAQEYIQLQDGQIAVSSSIDVDGAVVESTAQSHLTTNKVMQPAFDKLSSEDAEYVYKAVSLLGDRMNSIPKTVMPEVKRINGYVEVIWFVPPRADGRPHPPGPETYVRVVFSENDSTFKPQIVVGS